MTNRDDKKAKFSSDPRVPGNFRSRLILLGALVLVIAAGAGLYFNGRGSDDSGTVDYGQTTADVQTAPATIESVAVTSKVSDGKIMIDQKDIDKNRFVEFSYSKADGEEVPLLAYTTASGKTTVAVRMCEPCNSQSFHIEDDEIVCNACGTRWKTEDLSGVSGGCLTYPPEKLNHKSADGIVSISEADVIGWKPRV